MSRPDPEEPSAAAAQAGPWWRNPSILGASSLALVSGFAQFAVINSLADVARAFGEEGLDHQVMAEVGLTGATVGIGLGIVRFASIGALPLAAVADHRGRRRVLLACCAAGLVLTASSAASPGFWWFVAAVALARPLLSATNAVALVVCAEETQSRDRAKAVAMVSAAYAIGSGLVGFVRAAAADVLGFRGVFLLALLPLLLLPVVGRRLHEPGRYDALRAAGRQRPRLGHVPPHLRPRLALVCGLTAAMTMVTGAANSFLFLYAEGVVGLSPQVMAVAIASAGGAGLGGLLLGRWAADRAGRRVTAGAAMVSTAGVAILTYSGVPAMVLVGYVAGIAAQSVYAPAAGAIDTELFPTSARATATGWLTASGVLGAVTGLVGFGLLVDVFDSFAIAMAILAIPGGVAALGYVLLPETRGLELEESAPEDPDGDQP